MVQSNRDLVPVIECAGGLGAGLLISADGLLVTNRHVVEDTDVFMVSFFDGTKAKACLVHRNDSQDLAIIRAGVRRSTFFDLDTRIAGNIEGGDEVLAIGHPRGLSFTATRGIVSEPRRAMPDGNFVQTDVAINPGNSGGPLLDLGGRLVGLNTTVRRDSQGLGFAIPAADVVSYVVSVRGMLANGKLGLPTDEQIESLHQNLDPVQIVEAAIANAGLEVREKKPPHDDRQWTVFRVATSTNRVFSVYIDRSLTLSTCIATDIGPSRAGRASLLRLFAMQNEMNGPYFTLDVDGGLYSLHLWYQRPSPGLDVREATHAILLVADALDTHGDELDRLF